MYKNKMKVEFVVDLMMELLKAFGKLAFVLDEIEDVSMNSVVLADSMSWMQVLVNIEHLIHKLTVQAFVSRMFVRMVIEMKFLIVNIPSTEMTMVLGMLDVHCLSMSWMELNMMETELYMSSLELLLLLNDCFDMRLMAVKKLNKKKKWNKLIKKI